MGVRWISLNFGTAHPSTGVGAGWPVLCLLGPNGRSLNFIEFRDGPSEFVLSGGVARTVLIGPKWASVGLHGISLNFIEFRDGPSEFSLVPGVARTVLIGPKWASVELH